MKAGLKTGEVFSQYSTTWRCWDILWLRWESPGCTSGSDLLPAPCWCSCVVPMLWVLKSVGRPLPLVNQLLFAEQRGAGGAAWFHFHPSLSALACLCPQTAVGAAHLCLLHGQVSPVPAPEEWPPGRACLWEPNARAESNALALGERGVP